MPIPPINNISTTKPQKKVNYLSITGYSALGLGVASGIAAGNKKFKAHKTLAYLAGLLTLAHVGIIEWYRHQRTKK